MAVCIYAASAVDIYHTRTNSITTHAKKSPSAF